MRKVVASVFVTLDGVMETPEKWSLKYYNDEIKAIKHNELLAADALLLGRETYEIFAGSWPHMTDDSGFADRMNSIAKYVASNTLQNPEWANTTVLSGDIGDEVRKLKDQNGQDILLGGSADVINSLLRQGLVDEVKLLVYPVVLGAGKRLFASGTTVTLELLDTSDIRGGVVLHRYLPTA